MSTSRSQRQTLPPIQNLINAADRGMIDHNQHNAPMYGQNAPLHPMPPHPSSRSRSDYAYPTPPNSARSEGRTYPVQQQHAATAGGATSGSRRHVCAECGQTFDRPSSLQTHMNTHTGEQPFQCPYEGCGRRFSVKSNMRRHLSVHEQPRMTNADTEDERNAHRTNSCEYGVFSIAQHARR
ncbi:unnamed protein product [Rhizoctonia solani]|uniref:C2H2-type domain-containing protein n=1 Tax=Rhizoctonia solani TaxID=456999 RepID=A0A8H3HY38_9AGAM|nr:unnamed protein product [Rhizoctonia solani]